MRTLTKYDLYLFQASANAAQSSKPRKKSSKKDIYIYI